MKTANIPYLDKPVSRIVCGTDFLMGQAPYESFSALDAYWAAGGRTFDSAHCYGANTNVFAAWTTSRGIKDEVIYFDKGCHPYGSPRVTREDMRSDVFANHRNLGVEYTDFFVLHRDNPEVPVGEIVDWLNELKEEGRIGVFGGSNWHHSRIAAANEYAAKNGKQGFSLNNPNLCLAAAQEEMWKGAYAIDAEGRAWHEANQLPLFSWSSTGRGYFAAIDDKDSIRVYDNEANRGRRDRATELGKKYGLSATQIALAWVLNQPYPVFALCGLRSKANVAENVAALDLTLSPEELRYLEFGDA